MVEDSATVGSILVVDDNPLIVDVIRNLLRVERFRVYTSTNGSEALETLRLKKVDVVICDVMMPKMGGYQLHESIRANPDYAHIPFVFLTALDDENEIVRGRESGADDYLVKPFDPRELIALVKGKVSRSSNLRQLAEQRYDSYRKRVIHTLSHEFRTPLVAINTGTELLLDSLDHNSDRAKHLLDAVRRGGQRLERLVNDFMLIQQIEAGVAKRLFESKRSSVMIGTSLKRFLDSEARLVEGFSVTFHDHTNGAKVVMFEQQFHDILARLISNAVKFSGESRTLEICMYTLEQEIVIEIRDRGIGLNPDRIGEAVDCFGQLDRDKLEQQGGGLGLSIASRYAAIHGGKLEFELREGGGSTVSIVIPVAAVASASPAVPSH